MPPTISGQAEVPHFRESPSALDINVIDNRLEVQAYNQGHSPSSPVIASKIDYGMANTQTSFDPTFYPESHQMATTGFPTSSTEHFIHSPYTATPTQQDPWNGGSNASIWLVMIKCQIRTCCLIRPIIIQPIIITIIHTATATITESHELR